MSMQSQMIHHSALSFRKLTSMKIVDRSSCYIVGIKKDMADKALLAKYELFGQFGEILSIRIIQDKDPCEVYIRFASQASAVKAIDWCNSSASLFMNAKHGYQKYCIKFINGQNCKRSSINCPNRHSWADTKDILTFKNSRLVPNAVTQCCDQQDDNTKLSPNRCPTVPFGAKEKMRHDMEMRTLQNQFVSLQKQYAQQSRFVNDLVLKMQDLQRENTELCTRFYQQRNTNNRALMMQQAQRQQSMSSNGHGQGQQQVPGCFSTGTSGSQGQQYTPQQMMAQQQQGQYMMNNSMAMNNQHAMKNGHRGQQYSQPFISNSPELNLMASYSALPENTPLPELSGDVMNGGLLNDIVDQVIQSESTGSFGGSTGSL